MESTQVGFSAVALIFTAASFWPVQQFGGMQVQHADCQPCTLHTNVTHRTIQIGSLANHLSELYATQPTHGRTGATGGCQRLVSTKEEEPMSSISENLSLAAKVSETPDTFRFRTVDGLHSPDEFRTAELLLLEILWDQQLGDLLVPQANYGVVGTVLDSVAATVTMTETSARAVRLARENVDRNDCQATVSLVTSPSKLQSSFDTACYAPKPYTPLDVGKQQLVDAVSTLRSGGRLYVAGRKSSGINRYEQFLDEHASRVETVCREDSCRIIEATRPKSVDLPAVVSSKTTTARVDDVHLTMVTKPGLFSPNSLDDGTRFLLETASVEDGERVLDLACGYGPVGAYAAASADVDVVLTDENRRATDCAEATLAATDVDGTVVTADCLRGVDGRFDRVLCNPPTHAGSGVLSGLFSGVSNVLRNDGELSVVHHRTLNLDEHLGQVGKITDRQISNEHTVVTVRPGSN